LSPARLYEAHGRERVPARERIEGLLYVDACRLELEHRGMYPWVGVVSEQAGYGASDVADETPDGAGARYEL
jgi:hypothetical protein